MIDKSKLITKAMKDAECLDCRCEEIRSERDRRIVSLRWRVDRHNDELKLGLDTTEPVCPLVEKIQALREVPQQPGFPWLDGEIPWPEGTE